MTSTVREFLSRLMLTMANVVKFKRHRAIVGPKTCIMQGYVRYLVHVKV